MWGVFRKGSEFPRDRSCAQRRNASSDAPRSASERDAERPGLHSHAERGNDHMWGFPWPLRKQARSQILACIHRTIVGASLLAKAV
ncbi:hypothetical protein DMX04_00065 [Pseudomonas koreensis]|nr:hypothetical protein DMX04_00065 [Pseudomonas koreensis]